MASPEDSQVQSVVLGPIECWQDLYDLPGFQEQLPAEIMKAGIPLKPYAMSKKEGERWCGIAECRTNHRHGYVIQIGVLLSNVGHRCATKYFGRSEWKAHMRQLRKTESERAAQEALEQARQTARALAESADACPAGYAEVAAWLEVFDALPLGLRADLGERAHRSQAVIIQRREPSEAAIKLAKFYEKPKPRAEDIRVGALSGLKALVPNSRADAVSRRITQQKDRLRVLAGNASATTAQISEAMAALNGSVRLLGMAMERAREFFSEENQSEIEKLPNGMKFREVFNQHMAKGYKGAA